MSELYTSDYIASCWQQCAVLQRQLERQLNSRIEPFSLMLLAVLPAPRKTYRLVRGEQGFRVHVFDYSAASTEFVVGLQQELSAAIETIEKSCRELPEANIAEKLILGSKQLLWKVVESGIAPAPQDIVIRMLSWLPGLLMAGTNDARKFHHARSQVLSYLLQEPQRVVDSVLRWHQFYLHRNYARRLAHLRRSECGHSQVAKFIWPERDSYAAINRECGESRVLATIHMGDFFGAFKCIADSLDDARSVISLRREGETDGIRNLSHRHAASHKVFMHGKENPLSVVRALRAGRQSLSVLFDLGRDFGETTEVIFFGHRARFVRGPAELAIMGRARIYPFFCYSESGSDRISMEAAFLPELRAGESLHDAATRVTQMLATIAERWIRKHPAQWKYLDILPSYLLGGHPDQMRESKIHA